MDPYIKLKFTLTSEAVTTTLNCGKYQQSTRWLGETIVKAARLHFTYNTTNPIIKDWSTEKRTTMKIHLRNELIDYSGDVDIDFTYPENTGKHPFTLFTQMIQERRIIPLLLDQFKKLQVEREIGWIYENRKSLAKFLSAYAY